VTLRDFGVLTDENIHPGVVAFLRSEGFDTQTAVEAGLVGAEDVAVLRAAVSARRIVLTHDADFGRLAVAQGEPLLGVVYLRPGHIQPNVTIQTLRVILGKDIAVAVPFLLVARRAGSRVAIRVRTLG
jgi:predicted nuclease of predicted toxin-antitoxin system